MAETARRLHDEWKQADGLAREAEQELARQWDDFFQGNCEPPKQEALDLVKRMRELANGRLAEFVDYMRTTTKQ